MYQKEHNEVLSFEGSNMPFGGKLDPVNRWLIYSSLMPWEAS